MQGLCSGLNFCTHPEYWIGCYFKNYYPYYPALITWPCQICCRVSSVSVTLKCINCCCTLIIELHTNRLCCFNPSLKVALVKSLLDQVVVWKKALNKISIHYLSNIAHFFLYLLLIMCTWNNVTYQRNTELQPALWQAVRSLFLFCSWGLELADWSSPLLLFPADLWCIPMQWQFLPNGTLRNNSEDKTC